MGSQDHQQTGSPKPTSVPHDHTDRVLSVLEENARTNAALAGRVDHLERRVEDLEEEIKNQMGTMNAHLDNISREAAKTNAIMEAEADHRREMEEQDAKEKADAKKAEIEAQKDRRKLLVRAGSALWETFKTPLATLLTAIVAWLIYWYFWVPA